MTRISIDMIRIITNCASCIYVSLSCHKILQMHSLYIFFSWEELVLNTLIINSFFSCAYQVSEDVYFKHVDQFTVIFTTWSLFLSLSQDQHLIQQLLQVSTTCLRFTFFALVIFPYLLFPKKSFHLSFSMGIVFILILTCARLGKLQQNHIQAKLYQAVKHFCFGLILFILSRIFSSIYTFFFYGLWYFCCCHAITLICVAVSEERYKKLNGCCRL